MFLCPNCGEMVMKGDPYCGHCGSTLRWGVEEYNSGRSSRSTESVRNNVPIESFFSSLNQFNITSQTIDCIKRDLNISKAKNAVVNIGQEFPSADLNITFIRKNKYFSTIDSLLYGQFTNQIEGYRFISDFSVLRNTGWFQDAIRKKESEIGLKFYDCGGGYDAYCDWQNSKFELKDDCEVIAHFIKDEAYYLGFEVDFKYHRLKTISKEYSRANPYDLVKNFDVY